MKIKLKENQKREDLIFTAKAITNAFDNDMNDSIFYSMQDLDIAISQNNHNKLVQAINGLKGAIGTQKNIKLRYAIKKLNDMLE